MKLGGIPYWNKTFRKEDLWTLSNAFFTITQRIVARDWSRTMVYHSIDHGNDLTCHAEPVVLFLVFRKNNFSPQHGQRRTKF